MATALLTCQRIGCSARYSEDTGNSAECCRHHPSAPVFHDGLKEWPCCKRRSTDFGEFLSIPGCTVGAHTQEKPAAPPKAAQALAPVAVLPPPLPAASECARCRAGFYCTAHGASGGVAPTDAPPPSAPPAKPLVVAPRAAPNEEQTCRNAGCGEKFTEILNSDTACRYHSGPPVFHERRKGWSCCNKLADDFDDFLRIPTCTVGRHNATPTTQGVYAKTNR